MLVFDALNGHIRDRADGPIHQQYLPMVKNIRRLLDAAAAAQITVAYAVPNHRRDLPTWQRTAAPDTHVTKVWAGTWAAEVAPEVAPTPRDLIISKVRWSAFFGSMLDVALRLRDVRTLIVCGAATQVGIASTVYEARDLAYDLVIPGDATAGDPKVHDAFLHAFERFARVHSTDEVVAALA